MDKWAKRELYLKNKTAKKPKKAKPINKKTETKEEPKAEPKE